MGQAPLVEAARHSTVTVHAPDVPVLTPPAAAVLMRILLKAASEQDGADAVSRHDRTVRSQAP